VSGGPATLKVRPEFIDCSLPVRQTSSDRANKKSPHGGLFSVLRKEADLAQAA
jgi:hypothetical protein